MNRLFFKLLALGLFSYSALFSVSDEINKVIQNFSDRVDQQEGLSYTTSLKLGNKKIYEIDLYFSSKDPMPLDEVRDLILKVTEMFLSDVNNNSYLQADLVTFPLTPHQIDITIFFRGKNGKYASLPDIAQVSMHKGVIAYYKYANESFQIIKEESIEQASTLSKSS